MSDPRSCLCHCSYSSQSICFPPRSLPPQLKSIFTAQLTQALSGYRPHIGLIGVRLNKAGKQTVTRVWMDTYLNSPVVLGVCCVAMMVSNIISDEITKICFQLYTAQLYSSCASFTCHSLSYDMLKTCGPVQSTILAKGYWCLSSTANHITHLPSVLLKQCVDWLQ